MKRSSPGLDSTLSSFIPSDLEENSSRVRLQRETKRNDLEEDHEKGCFDLRQREIFSSAHLFGSVGPFSRDEDQREKEETKKIERGEDDKMVGFISSLKKGSCHLHGVFRYQHQRSVCLLQEWPSRKGFHRLIPIDSRVLCRSLPLQRTR